MVGSNAFPFIPIVRPLEIPLILVAIVKRGHVVTTDDRNAAAELERIICGSVQAKIDHKTWQFAQGNA